MDKISIVVPTFNESGNIKELLESINENCGNKFDCEILIVDDGSDNTSLIAENLGARVIKGQHKGLGQAIVDGIFKASNAKVVVMDADLSHNPKYITGLVMALDFYGMSIGSRYANGGGVEGWSLKRRIISRGACLLALPVTSIKDSTSGFFAVRKEILKGVFVKSSSWKIMLEIAVKTNAIYREVPIIFKDRQNGESKFNKKQVVAYLKHLVSLFQFKYFGKE
jgi:dolichol-phosphate mannosyltransferase